MQLLPAITDLQVIDTLGRERLSVSRREDDRTDSLQRVDEPGLLPVTAALPLRYGRTFHREDLSPMMRMAVFDGSSAIVATVDLRLLGEVVSRLRIGKQGAAYIVDASDVLIAHPHPTEVLRRPDLRGFDAVRRARAAHWTQDATLALSDTQDLEGRPVIATAARIEAPGWLLIVEQPRTEALRPVLEALVRTGLLVALGGVAAVVAGVLFARRMAAPIVTLRRATARIAGGDLSSPIEVHSRDEIEDLAHDFNLMAAHLRESYAGLEAKVAERTTQLSEARDKLALRAAEVNSLNERLVDQLGQLAKRRDEAERASAAKTRFLATASHDLRQPMHSISLLVGVLHDRMVDREARAIAGKVQASVSTMEGLFGSLLDISKLDAGAVRPEITEFPLAALFARVEQV
jgi:signal transduction histidine kinase